MSDSQAATPSVEDRNYWFQRYEQAALEVARLRALALFLHARVVTIHRDDTEKALRKHGIDPEE